MYTFIEKEPLGPGTRVFKLLEKGQAEWQATEVWYSADGRANCCSCSTILVGMSASCKHAKALRRRMNRATAGESAGE